MRKFRTKREISLRRRRPTKTETDVETIRCLPTWRIVFYVFTLSYVFLMLSVAAYLYQRGFFSRQKEVVNDKELPDTPPTFRTFSGLSRITQERKSPCFGSVTLLLHSGDPDSKTNTLGLSQGEILRIREYLNKLNRSYNGYQVLRIPDWAGRVHKLENGTYFMSKSLPTSPFFLTAVLRVRLYEEDKARLTLAELKQWIHYQFWAGVEHVYICNHYLQDSERLEPWLSRYINLGLVTVYPWNNIKAVPGTVSYLKDNTKNQDGCYNFVLLRHKLDTVWQYNMDMDEYPFMPGDQCEGFLKRYLLNLDAGYKKEVTSQIKLSNFLMKGVGDRSRDMTIDRINRIDRKESNPLVKPIYKLEFTSNVGTHGVTTTLGNTIRPLQGDIMMLHYWGARTQNWGPDTDQTLRETNEFNVVRETIAVNVRHSLLAFADFGGFNSSTGP